jgi:hypothetical protein
MTSQLRKAIHIGLSSLVFWPGVSLRGQQVANGKVQHGNVVVGILESAPNEASNKSEVRYVRVVFEKIGDGWKAFPTKTKSYHDLQSLPMSYPKKMTWTIAFDGKDIGKVTSEVRPHFDHYADIGIEEITSHEPIPTVGRKSTDYSGSFPNVPVYRPLVALSRSNASDPELWKRSQLPSKQVAAARDQFRSKFPKASNCRNPEENIPRSWKYRDEDIKVRKSYSAKDGSALAELSLTGYACDGPLGNGNEFDGQWYIIDSSGSAKFLGTNMWLVDAGDYDNDGKSEVLFSIRAYNEGGYRLFYQNFQRNAEFVFHYH